MSVSKIQEQRERRFIAFSDLRQNVQCRRCSRVKQLLQFRASRVQRVTKLGHESNATIYNPEVYTSPPCPQTTQHGLPVDCVGMALTPGLIDRSKTTRPRAKMDTLKVIRDFLSEQYGIPVDKITPETALDQLGIDSLMFIELLFEFDSKFGIPAPEKDIGDVKTIGELVALVNKIRAERQ